MTAPDDFEAWMAREIAENGGVEFGADYRHWALKGYRAAIDERLTHPAQAVDVEKAAKRLGEYLGAYQAVYLGPESLRAAIIAALPNANANGKED